MAQIPKEAREAQTCKHPIVATNKIISKFWVIIQVQSNKNGIENEVPNNSCSNEEEKVRNRN